MTTKMPEYKMSFAEKHPILAVIFGKGADVFGALANVTCSMVSIVTNVAIATSDVFFMSGISSGNDEMMLKADGIKSYLEDEDDY